MLLDRKDYPSDLAEHEWDLIEDLVPKAKPGGRPRTTDIRSVLNAIFYVLRSGCAWRYLPKNYPPWRTVYGYFSAWSALEVWEQIEHTLSRAARLMNGKTLEPSIGIIDTQSVKGSHGEERGYDGFKKVRGRKRHIIVDSLGLIIAVEVQAANLADPVGGSRALRRIAPSYIKALETILADRLYGNYPFPVAVAQRYEKKLILSRSPKEGSNLKPLRWVVERTFAWFNHFRRLARDYERKTCHSESMLFLSITRILLARISH